MPRASKYFKLGRTQAELDFVDVDVVGDVQAFVDPLALRPLAGDWAMECVGLLQSFFNAVLDAIRTGNHGRAAQLLGKLNEPNEVHLGFSKGRARGRGVGDRYGVELASALSKSEAIETGLLSDLEDTILMVEGVSFDLVSDMAVNIIREPLIHYTQYVCRQFGIPLAADRYVGPTWDPASQSWVARYFDIPVAKNASILFVPKAIVRRKLQYDGEEYFRDFLLPFLEQEEIAAKTSLVRVVKGEPRVTKKDLIAKYGKGKALIVRLSQEHPDILKRYKAAKRELAQEALEHEDVASLIHGKPPDWDGLLRKVTEVPTGRPGEDAYHKAIAGLLTALFYPTLTDPHIEYKIHEGRKRVDIAFVNQARDGFFRWLALNYRAPHVYVECKNYAGDPANPELDQLSGRFSPDRGQVGVLACRGFQNKELFIQRCRDTAKDGRGYVIPIDDTDISLLVAAAKMFNQRRQFELLKATFDRLIN